MAFYLYDEMNTTAPFVLLEFWSSIEMLQIVLNTACIAESAFILF